jgi:hypothetical protein
MDAIGVTPLSDAVIAVCEKHYGKMGSGCGRCPILTECTGGMQWSDEGLREWRERCNEAALRAGEAA